jgi:hypothetical protein
MPEETPKPVLLRLPPALYRRVEAARGAEKRSVWLRNAIELALSTEGKHADAQRRAQIATHTRARAPVAPFQRSKQP